MLRHENTLEVYDIFNSISGEVCSFGQGRIATFIRLSQCNLRCSWCDAKNAVRRGTYSTTLLIDEIINRVLKYNCRYVVLTGGEPLLQNNVYKLIEKLDGLCFYVAIETNGTIDPFDSMNNLNTKGSTLNPFGNNISWVVDYKLKYKEQFKFNIMNLKNNDYIKFLISSEKEIQEAIEVHKKLKKKLREEKIEYTYPRFAYSIVMDDGIFRIDPKKVLSAINKEGLDAFINVQIHKFLEME